MTGFRSSLTWRVPGTGRCLRALCGLLGLAIGIGAAPALQARTLGMVADHAVRLVTVFDADTGAVIGSVRLQTNPFDYAVGDALILPDQSLGFVTDGARAVWVIDLSVTPPVLAAGVNPIPIDNPGRDLALSPDGRFLVAAGGISAAPVSVIEVATRAVTSFDLGGSINAVDVCRDGTVAVVEGGGRIQTYVLDSSGNLRGTGLARFTGGTNQKNAVCTPDGRAVVTIGATNFGDPTTSVQTFGTGLQLLGARSLPLGAFGVAGVFNASGNRIFLRSTESVGVFEYNALSQVVLEPLAVRGGLKSTAFDGMEQLALHEAAGRLYVSTEGQVLILDAETLDVLGNIPGLFEPSGIAIAPTVLCGNARLENGEQCDDGNAEGADGCSAMCQLEDATLGLSPERAKRIVTEAHTLRAHLAFDGTAAIGEDVLFSVSGANPSENRVFSNTDGDAVFLYHGSEPGDDEIRACWDQNRDGACAPTEPAGVASARWAPIPSPDSTVGCHIRYRGEIRLGKHGRASFRGSAQVVDQEVLTGGQDFTDHSRRPVLNARSISIDRVVCGKDHAVIEGLATTFGAFADPVAYVIELTDAPGSRPDRYRIRISTEYDSGNQPLRSGDVQIRTRGDY